MSQSVMDKIKAKMQQMDQQSGRREKTHKLKAGKNKIRILPGWNPNDRGTFWHDFGQHFIKGMTANEQGSYLQAVYICVNKTFGRHCELCDMIEEGIRTVKNDDLLNKLKESTANFSVLVNGLVLDGDDPHTPQIIELRPTVFRSVLDLFGEWGDVTQLSGGVDLIINKEGRGLNTKYSVMPAPKSIEVPQSVLEKLHNLDDYVKQEYDQGKLKALTAVRQVAGALPAPSAATQGGNTSATWSEGSAAPAQSSEEDDALGQFEAAAETSNNVIDSTAVVEQPAPASAPAAAAPAIADDELDQLLAGL